MAVLDALKAAVTKNEDAGDSTILLLTGIAAKLRELKTTDAALQAEIDGLAAQLESQAGQFVEAINANTDLE